MFGLVPSKPLSVRCLHRSKLLTVSEGCQSIDLKICRFNFYLDEMISIRNRFTAGELYRQGAKPHFRTEAFLRGQE